MTESNKRLKTKRIIEEAMVRLLEKESFDQITTVELAQESGISRSSFYTCLLYTSPSPRDCR